MTVSLCLTGVLQLACKNYTKTGEIKTFYCKFPSEKSPYGTCKHIAEVVVLKVKFR